MCENLRYHYRDFMLRAHQYHKGKDSGEVGLERKENRQMYRLQDAMREERGHTQTKRQRVRKPRRQRRQDKGEQEKTRKQKEAEIVKTMRKRETEGRQRQQPGQHQTCPSSCSLIPPPFLHSHKTSLNSNNDSLPTF